MKGDETLSKDENGEASSVLPEVDARLCGFVSSIGGYIRPTEELHPLPTVIEAAPAGKRSILIVDDSILI